MAAANAEETALQTEADERKDEPVIEAKQLYTDEDVLAAAESDAIPFPRIKHAQTNLTTASGGRPYSSFSSGKKWFIVILSAIAGTSS